MEAQSSTTVVLLNPQGASGAGSRAKVGREPGLDHPSREAYGGVSRSTATAAARVMVGKWWRITSRRSPAARFAKRTSIGVEVPSKHG